MHLFSSNKHKCFISSVCNRLMNEICVQNCNCCTVAPPDKQATFHLHLDDSSLSLCCAFGFQEILAEYVHFLFTTLGLASFKVHFVFFDGHLIHKKTSVSLLSVQIQLYLQCVSVSLH